MSRPEVNRFAEMEVFVRAVELGGFSAAARALGMTPSAVSKLVARLEARLGVRLLNRSTRKLQLTAEGGAFHDRSVRLLADLAEAERGTAKTQLLLHAKEWYEQAAAKLSGFSKTQVDKRLKDINVATGQDKAADRSVPTAPKDSYEYQIAMGRSCYRQGNYARAQAFFAEALRLKPDDRRAAVYLRQAKFQKHLTAGYAFANNGLFDEAIRELQLALEEKPNDPAAVNTLNQVLQLQKGGAQGKGKGKGS